MDHRRSYGGGKDVGYIHADSKKAWEKEQREQHARGSTSSKPPSGASPASKGPKPHRNTEPTMLRPNVPKSVSARVSGRYTGSSSVTQSMDFGALQSRVSGTGSRLPTLPPSSARLSALPPIPTSSVDLSSRSSSSRPELRSLLDLTRDKDNKLQQLENAKAALTAEIQELKVHLQEAEMQLAQFKSAANVAATSSEICKGALAQSMVGTYDLRCDVQDQIDSMAGQVKMQEQALMNKQVELDAARQEVQELAEELYKAENQVSKLTAALAQASMMDDKVVALEAELESKDIEVSYLRDLAARMRHEVTSLTELVDDQERLGSDNLHLAAQCESLRAELAVSKSEIANSKAQEAKLKEMCNTLEEECDALRCACKELDDEQTSLNAEVDKLVHERADLTDRLEHALIAAATGTASVERDLLSSELEHQKHLELLQQQHQSLVANCNALRADNEALERHMQEQANELEELRERCSGMGRQLGDTQYACDNAEIEREDLVMALAERDEQVRELQAELRDMEQTVQEARQKLEAARRVTTDSQNQVDMMHAHESELLERIRVMDTERQSLLEQLHSLQLSLQEAKSVAAEATALREQCATRQVLLEQSTASEVSAQVQIERLQVELKRLESMKAMVVENQLLAERRSEQLASINASLESKDCELAAMEGEVRLLRMQVGENGKLRHRVEELEGQLAAAVEAAEAAEFAQAQADAAAAEAAAALVAPTANDGGVRRRGARPLRVLLSLLSKTALVACGVAVGVGATTSTGQSVIGRIVEGDKSRKQNGRSQAEVAETAPDMEPLLCSSPEVVITLEPAGLADTQ